MTSRYANICVEMSTTHSRPNHLLVVVPGINGTVTHAQITIEYRDNGRRLCSLCSSPLHLEGTCPHKPGFEIDYNDMDYYADPFLVISEESSSTAASQADAMELQAAQRGIAAILSPDSIEEHEEEKTSNMQHD